MAEREKNENAEIESEETASSNRYGFSESGRYRAERIAMWIEEALAPMDIP